MTPQSVDPALTEDLSPLDIAAVESLADGDRLRPLGITTGAILWMVFSLGILLLYLPGIDVAYYGDDFQFIFAPATSILRYFTAANPENGWYRPLEASYLSVVQRYFGWNTVPIHAATITLHATLCCLIFFALARTGSPRSEAGLAAGYMALSQANAFAVLSNDTLSQIGATLFGCLSVWALACRNDRTTAREKIYPAAYWFSVAAFVAALLSKEASLSFFAMIALVALLQNKQPGRLAVDVRRLAKQLAPFALVVIAYMTVRRFAGAVQPSLGSGDYDFHLGFNVLKNFAMFVFAAAVPASSLKAVAVLHGGAAPAVAVIVAATLTLLGAIAYGLWRRRGDRRLPLLLACSVLATLPMIVLNHVSELYVYNLMPFFATLAAIGIGALWREARGLTKAVVASLLVVGACSHIAAVREKASLMRENGVRTAALVNEIGAFVGRVPQGGELLLVQSAAAPGAITYGVYHLRGFDLLRFGETVINKRFNRPDIRVNIVAREGADTRKLSPNSTALVLDSGHVKLSTRSSGR